MFDAVTSRQNTMRGTRLVTMEVASRLQVLTGVRLQVHADSMKLAETMIKLI